MILRPYQSRDIKRIRAAFTRSRAVLYQLPTGGGKTVIYAAAARLAVERGGRVLILEHRRELVEQAVAALRRLNLTVGITAAGVDDPAPDAPIRVAMIQTLARRGASAFDPTLVVVDEAHLAAAATWRRALLEWYGATWRLGVTATPRRLDGRALGDLFGEIVVGPTVADLIDGGHLVPMLTYSIPGADFSRCKVARGDYTAAGAAEIIDRPMLVGDAVDHYARLCGDKLRPALFYTTTVAHAGRVRDALVDAGYRAAMVSGTTPKLTRAATLAALAAGELDAVTNCGVLTEGFDCPPVSYIGLLRPTKSAALYLQIAGRALRPAPGKIDAILADHAGNARRHGLVESAREWSLDGAGEPMKRADLICGECCAQWSPKLGAVCPRCGCLHAPWKPERGTRDIVAVDGELARLSGDEIAERQRRISRAIGPRRAPSWADAAIWDQCETTRQRRGYKLGWTYYAVKRIQGFQDRRVAS